MRTRFLAGIVVSMLSVSALALPAAANAAPRFDHGLTIAVTPDPITSGQGVLIYGRLHGPNAAHKRIYLFHRINPAYRFTPVSVTRTNAGGFYEFVRADGVVTSNRNWFVVGPYNSHSRTIHELVSSVVTLTSNIATANTGQQVQLNGNVSPNHPHQRVLIQEQNSSSGNGWKTVTSTVTGANSNFSTTHAFRAAGSYTLRAYFPADARNTAGQSSDLTLTVQQTQNPSFTVNASAAVISDGQMETITGTLYAAGSTTTAQPNVPVTLYGKQDNGSFAALASTTTDASGNYSFTQVPLHNTVYRVDTASGPSAQTANLFVGVQDVLTITPSTTTVAVGDTVTITGTVTPDHSGHAVYLQQQDAAGNWEDVARGYVNAGSQYSFAYTAGEPETAVLRVQITGGPVNLAGTSSPVTLTVTGVAAASTLPAAS